VRSIPAGDRTLTVNGVGDLAATHFTSNATFTFHFVDVSIPAGYYDAATGLRGSALLIALHNIIKGHTRHRLQRDGGVLPAHRQASGR